VYRAELDDGKTPGGRPVIIKKVSYRMLLLSHVSSGCNLYARVVCLAVAMTSTWTYHKPTITAYHVDSSLASDHTHSCIIAIIAATSSTGSF